MIQKLFAGLILMATVAGVSSCCKKRVYCEHESLNVAFTGFDRSQVRTITVKRYTPGDGERKKALDSAQLVNNTAIVNPAKPDTSRLSSYVVTLGAAFDGIKYGYDYIIYVGSINKTYYIADIKEGDKRYEKVTCKDNNTKCTTSINNYSIDGFWVTGTNTLYIKK